MRRLDLVEFISLDGVMQGLAGPERDFPHGGWGQVYPVDVEDDSGSEPFAGTTGYLFGRKTYEHMVAFWPHQPDTNPTAASLNHTQKHVADNRDLRRCGGGRHGPEGERRRRDRRARQRPAGPSPARCTWSPPARLSWARSS